MPPVNPGAARGERRGWRAAGAGCSHSQEWKKPWKSWMLPGTAVAGGLERRDLQVEALPGGSWFDIPGYFEAAVSDPAPDGMFGFYPLSPWV